MYATYSGHHIPTVVSPPTRMLGIEPRSTIRAVSAQPLSQFPLPLKNLKLKKKKIPLCKPELTVKDELIHTGS